MDEPGAAHIDMDLRRPAAVGRTADQEGLHRLCQRFVCRIPLVCFQKEIFAIGKTEQRHRREYAAFQVAPEQNREMCLRLPEFGRHQQAGHDGIAQCRPAVGPNTQGAMGQGIKDLVLCHDALMAPLTAVPVPRHITAVSPPG